jgi:cytochrome c556
MSKLRVLALVIVAAVFCPVIAFAQGPDEKKEPVMTEQMKEKPTGQEYAGGMAMKMMGMMQKQMVATNDGGVIVLLGNKLIKYDKDLNLIKEVEVTTEAELKIDIGSMQDMMKNMKEKYGKHGKMTQGESQDTEKK